jgi:hypothetical protein
MLIDDGLLTREADRWVPTGRLVRGRVGAAHDLGPAVGAP